MRLGLDVTPLGGPLSGVGVYTLNLWRSLRARPGMTVLPLAHQRLYRSAGGRRGPRLPKTAWMQLALPGQLRRLGVELAHFTNSVAPLWAPCPTIITLHDMTLWLHPEYHYALRLLSMRPFIGPAARRARAVIAVSNSTAADAIRLLGLPPEKVHVIPEAPAPIFRPLPPEQAQAALRGLDLPRRFVFFVGTLEPRKNLLRLLEALALARRRLPDLGLVLAGQPGWKLGDLRAAASHLALDGAVHLLGYVPQTRQVALYNLAQALVFPSLHEGFGLPVLEAMACGAPVITAPVGGLLETAGDAVEYVDPHSAAAIDQAIEHIVTDEGRRRELRAGGLERAARFSWAKTAAQTEAVYTRALQGRDGGA